MVATIPSFGPNEHGPGGWYQVKVRDDRVAHYESLGPDYEGPVPYDDLYRDATGEPIEGHLTIASFAWWTARFAEAGFERCGEVERAAAPAPGPLRDDEVLEPLRAPGARARRCRPPTCGPPARRWPSGRPLWGLDRPHGRPRGRAPGGARRWDGRRAGR